MNCRNSQPLLLACVVAILGALLVSFFSYCTNDSAREPAYDQNFNELKLRQVIMEGKERVYEMGKSMRSRYYDFITPYNAYVEADVKAVTVNLDRCFETAALLLAGLYPPKGRQIWNHKLRWQPVPIQTSTPDKSYVFSSGRSACPLYFDEMNLANETGEVIDKLIGYFSNYVNFSDDAEKRYLQLFVVCDTIRSQVKINIPQPVWIRDIYSDLVVNFLKYSFNHMAHNYQLKRLISGTLLADIASQMQMIVAKNGSSKIYLYSGQDVSVAGLLHSLDLPPAFVIPDYGASLIFELYSSPQPREEYYVKILYNEDTTFSKLETKKLADCEQLCPLDKFMTTIKPLFMTETEWQTKCHSAAR